MQLFAPKVILLPINHKYLIFNMYKIGDIITCMDPVDDLRQDFDYVVTQILPGRVRVKCNEYYVSSLLTHHFDRFREYIHNYD